MEDPKPLALCLQPACVKHRWIRTSNASHIYERPERIRAVLLGAAAAISRLESSETQEKDDFKEDTQDRGEEENRNARESTTDVSDLLGSLNISGSTPKPTPQSNTSDPESRYLHIPQPVQVDSSSSLKASRTIHNHPALQIVHAPLEDTSLTTLANNSSTLFPQSPYLKQLCTWALEAPEKIKKGECEIPSRYDPGVAGSAGERKEGESSSMVELNQSDLYLGPGSVEAIEGCVSTPSQHAWGQSYHIVGQTKPGTLYADYVRSPSRTNRSRRSVKPSILSARQNHLQPQYPHRATLPTMPVPSASSGLRDITVLKISHQGETLSNSPA